MGAATQWRISPAQRLAHFTLAPVIIFILIVIKGTIVEPTVLDCQNRTSENTNANAAENASFHQLK